jgi:methylmalonyl-CoA mutase
VQNRESTTGCEQEAGGHFVSNHASKRWIDAAGGQQAAERLVRKTVDGLTRGPVFEAQPTPPAPGHFPFTRGTQARRPPFQPFDALSAIRHTDLDLANRRALEELTKGAHGVSFCLPGRIDAQSLTALVSGIDMSLAPLHFSEIADNEGLFCAVQAIKLPQDAALHLAIDPVTEALTDLCAGIEPGLERLNHALGWSKERLPKARIGRISSALIHDAGGTDIAEIALILSGLHAVLSQRHGTDAFSAMDFEIVASSDLHLTIAKLRALRVVIAHLAEAHGIERDAARAFIVARNARRDLQHRDPWNNILRLTSAAAGAAIGGADAIALDSFGGNAHQSSLTRRVSRNIQIVLRDEAGLGRVLDPAGGSGLHEYLTQGLIERSWAAFQALEREGGLRDPACLKAFVEGVRRDGEALCNRIESGGETLLGVNAFANLEPRSAAREVDPDDDGGSIHKGFPGDDPAFAYGLRPISLGRRLEALQTEASALRGNAVVLTLGEQRAHGARTQWVRNRLAVGGILAHEIGENDREALETAGLVILSGSDESTLNWLANEPVRSRGFSCPLWVAGDLEDKATGGSVSHFIHRKTSLLDDLKQAHHILGLGA